jgi:hypothetical protein
MLDCSTNIREIYLGVLEESILYNNVQVPVYGQIPFETPPQNYVVIGNITESADNNNQRFNNDVDVTIEIYSEQYRTNDLSIVDNISSQILDILIQNPGVTGFENAYWQVFPKARTSSLYSNIDNGQNYIARKIIIINNYCNQIN